MILLKELGIIDRNQAPAIVEIDGGKLADIRDELQDAARNLVRAGVNLTGADWFYMVPEEKAAWLDARDELRNEQAAKIGRCVWDPEYRALLLESQDGGEELRDVRKQVALLELGQGMDRIFKDMTNIKYVRR